MIRALTGIQIGPRQFELPPNIPVLDSAGRYWTRYSWPPAGRRTDVVEVEARERPDAVGAEEFLFVEHLRRGLRSEFLLRENRAELGVPHDRRTPFAGRWT